MRHSDESTDAVSIMKTEGEDLGGPTNVPERREHRSLNMDSGLNVNSDRSSSGTGEPSRKDFLSLMQKHALSTARMREQALSFLCRNFFFGRFFRNTARSPCSGLSDDLRIHDLASRVSIDC